MPQVIPTAAQMTELTNAILGLIVAIVLGISGIVAAYLYQWKIAMPARFKAQTREREAQLLDLEQRIANKAAAEKVDIERDRMLPQLIENNQQLVNAVLKMGNSFNDTTIRRIEQDVTNNQTLLAHSRAVVSNTERLEEFSQTLDTAIINIQRTSEDARETRNFSEQAANAARETLILLKKKLDVVIEEEKSKTGEPPPLKDIAKETPTAGGLENVA